jgi:hypothetical protein
MRVIVTTPQPGVALPAGPAPVSRTAGQPNSVPVAWEYLGLSAPEPGGPGQQATGTLFG